ncbi:ATP-binding protein [Pyruvatibacter sp.]|uniref:ATP-binding protein n=1 Tax=Pyruvatibacter sp. TaxID=1981328 RepID=UPI0032665008
MFILLLGGTAAGTVATLASLPVLITIALSTSVIPLIIRLATDGQFEQQLMSGALVMYFMAMMATGRNSGSMADMAFSLKLENTELITSLERERHELEISNRAKTRFLAAASHDLRQPLHAMNLTVAAYRIREKSKGLEPLFDRVDRSTQAMEGLVNSLLDISKLDAGTVDVKTTPVSVDDVISAITSEASEMATAGNSRIIQEPSGIEIDTDPTLLGSIIRNLLGNAIRHAPGSTIDVSAYRHKNGDVVVSVSDDGPGIEPHLQERVFEEFYQADGASQDQGGLGLGLAIVKRLSVLLGGSITLSSIAGRGTRFEVMLPGHLSMEPIAMQEARIKPSPPALNDLCVAVLEDDKDSQAALLDLVCAWGCDALAGRNADEIINSPYVTDGGFAPQIIISDFQLGRSQEGPTEIALLRAHFKTPELPAILLTGDSSPDRLRQLASVHLDVLHKPVNPNTLADLLRRLAD